MDELIYNQTKIPRDQWRYGFRTSAATGCGWVATHNALRLLGYETDISELIRYYERQLPLIHGMQHLVLAAAHPSPLSAYNGFFGCKHLSKTHAFLTANGQSPIDWQIHE